MDKQTHLTSTPTPDQLMREPLLAPNENKTTDKSLI